MEIILVFIALGIALFWLVLSWQRNRARAEDSTTWQRQIDREYRLEISSNAIVLYHLEQIASHFEFIDPIEIQHIGRDVFPPLMWKIVLKKGEFFLPNGGRYADEFKKQFIYLLPGYYEQKTVEAAPPEGFNSAQSMWRKEDPYPKREQSNEEIFF